MTETEFSDCHSMFHRVFFPAKTSYKDVIIIIFKIDNEV